MKAKDLIEKLNKLSEDDKNKPVYITENEEFSEVTDVKVMILANIARRGGFWVPYEPTRHVYTEELQEVIVIE